MARFVAKYPNYSHGVRNEIVENYATGKSQVKVRSLEAQFDRTGVTEDEIAEALSTFTFNGLPEDRDTRSEVSGRSRISVYDSEQHRKLADLSDEEHDLIVDTLRLSPSIGTEFIEIVAPVVKAPWPGYDKLDDVQKISELVLATGSDPAQVIAYELQNSNREAVIRELELLLETETVDWIQS